MRQVHWHQWNIIRSSIKYLTAGWVFRLLTHEWEVEYPTSGLKTSLSHIWVISPVNASLCQSRPQVYFLSLVLKLDLPTVNETLNKLSIFQQSHGVSLKVKVKTKCIREHGIKFELIISHFKKFNSLYNNESKTKLNMFHRLLLFFKDKHNS